MSTLSPFLSPQQIEAHCDRLGKQISADYSKILGPGEALTVVVTLKGALYFAADLTRRLTVPVKLDFVRLSSYGTGTKSSGTVRFLMDMETPPAGQHILVLDEIVDSGRTLAFLLDRIKAAQPASVRLCSLLSKPSRREVPVNIDYLGQEVEDKFLVGYGLDHAENHRHHSGIFVLDSGA
ncbi:hypoxanthine phosphoribosyltransferase [bacterium]|nr:hypoxanthine phosphoribosyltransferase [bacterium]